MSNIKHDNSELDEANWQVWISKNEVRDRLRFERRLRVLAVAAAIAGLSALLWRFA